MQNRVIRALIFITGSLLTAAPATAQDPFGPPREVRIGLLMTDLSEVNDAEQEFSADVFLIATWRDPALVDSSDGIRTLGYEEIWHPTLLIYNRRSLTESLPPDVSVRPDGTVTYLQRYTGWFSAPMSLREFPRDKQEFYVWLVAPARVGANVRLVPEDTLDALRGEKFSVSDWDVGEASLTAAEFQVAPGAPMNQGIKLSLPASRRVTYYTIQVLIPLIAIVMMAYAVFWIAPAVIPTRVGVVMTTMLTLIAYRFMLANHVPPLPYLTRLDWFMLGATVLVMVTLFTMAGSAYLLNRERDAIVLKIDRAGRVLYPLAFVVYSLIVWFG
jgi:hypothetical protein